MATPTPVPGPVVPGAPSLNAANGLLDTGSSSGGSLYGANSDVLGATFTVTGLPGLIPGLGNNTTATGKQIMQSFLALGQKAAAGDGNARSLVAAIEYALYAAGPGVYYSASAKPNLHSVSNVDASALGQALTDLMNVNAAGAGTTSGGQQGGVQQFTNTMSVAQFLTSQAGVSASAGPQGAAAAARSRKPKIVHEPNPATVAAMYQKVAQNLEGERPSVEETQQFVQQYMKQYEQAVGLGPTGYANAAAYAQKTPAGQNSLVTGPPTPPPAATGGTPQQTGGVQLPHGITATDPNSGMSPEQPVTGSADLQQSMDTLASGNPNALQTLQDVIGQNTASGPAAVGVSVPESVAAAAENFARNENPTAVRQNDLGSTLDMFLNLIGSKLGA